jgi:hypothetical protein
MGRTASKILARLNRPRARGMAGGEDSALQFAHAPRPRLGERFSLTT